jgi:hypothetical protein
VHPQDLRERLGVLESVVEMEEDERTAVAAISAESDGPNRTAPATTRGTEHVLTAGSAALLELIDLRKENKVGLGDVCRRRKCFSVLRMT